MWAMVDWYVAILWRSVVWYKVIPLQAMEACARLADSFMHSYPDHWMELSDQLNVAIALTTGKEPPVPIA